MRPIDFGRWLRSHREERGFTQEEMARQLNISRQALFMLESGRGLPSIPLACRIARWCNRPLDELFFNKDNEEKKEVGMRPFFDPFSELDRLHREIDRMFQGAFRPALPGSSDQGKAGFSGPAVNIRQTEKDIVIEAELPGVTAKDLQINLTENTLLLRGERKSETKHEEGDVLRQEVSYGSFSREITLPIAVKAEEAETSLKNGLLTICVPKRATTPRGRELTIREE